MKPIIRDKSGKFVPGSGSPREKPVYISCLICGNAFRTIPSQVNQRKTCSMRCVSVLKKGRAPHNIVDDGSRSLMKNGYIRIKSKGKWRYEHRVVMEERIGRPLTRTEIVHHIDHNRTNNLIGNLELMDKRAHDSMETLKRWADGTMR